MPVSDALLGGDALGFCFIARQLVGACGCLQSSFPAGWTSLDHQPKDNTADAGSFAAN
jgi:hypothetical protein